MSAPRPAPEPKRPDPREQAPRERYIDITQTSLFSRPSRSVSPTDVALWAKALASMLSSGIPLLSALSAQAEQYENDNPVLAAALRDAASRVRNGASLEEAFVAHEKVLGRDVVELIAVGEKTGALTTTLEAAARIYKIRARTRAQAKKLLIYPAVLVSVGFVVTTIIAFVLVPALETMYRDMGGGLPLPTKIVLAISKFARSIWGLATAGAIAGAVAAAVAHYRRSARAREAVDRALLRAPALKKLVQAEAVSASFATFGVMLGAGGEMWRALEAAARTCPNRVIARAFEEAVPRLLKHGEPLAVALARPRVLPYEVIVRVESGEKAGNLEEVCRAIAESYEERANDLREMLEKWIEYASLIIMSVYVGALVISLYLPLFGLIAKLAGKH